MSPQVKTGLCDNIADFFEIFFTWAQQERPATLTGEERLSRNVLFFQRCLRALNTSAWEQGSDALCHLLCVILQSCRDYSIPPILKFQSRCFASTTFCILTQMSIVDEALDLNWNEKPCLFSAQLDSSRLPRPSPVLAPAPHAAPGTAPPRMRRGVYL